MRCHLSFAARILRGVPDNRFLPAPPPMIPGHDRSRQRILVDIALKALSPAINDPTTAVLAVDQLHRLLRLAGKRNLHNEYISDGLGQLRVILRTPNWEDFVDLVLTEIRHY